MMFKDELLISGVGSGLGKYLHRKMGGFGLTRVTKKDIPDKVDVVIHCAFNSSRKASPSELVQDNIVLTHDLLYSYGLLRNPHNLFIYISSIEVYPKKDSNTLFRFHTEEEEIKFSDIKTTYGTFKYISESLVRNYASKYLILRPSALLGVDSRPNSLIRMIRGEREVRLRKDSLMNYVLHSDIEKFILYAIEKNIQGTFNLVSDGNISLKGAKKVIDAFSGKKDELKYGDFFYSCGNVSAQKAVERTGFPIKTSEEVLREFIPLLREEDKKNEKV